MTLGFVSTNVLWLGFWRTVECATGTGVPSTVRSATASVGLLIWHETGNACDIAEIELNDAVCFFTPQARSNTKKTNLTISKPSVN